MNILIVSIHPDDETLGCGGTIFKHVKQGEKIFWLILTGTHDKEGYTQQFINERKKQIDAISKIYNFSEIYQLNYPTTKLHQVEFTELVSKISEIMYNIKPQVIYMPNRSDIHTDHQIGVKAILSCSKIFRYPFIKRILMYECISETEIAPPLPENVFIPNVYSDITEYIEDKLETMKVYSSEIQEPPFPRSIDNIKALAQFRGSSSGVMYAEAFMLIRDIF